MQTWFPEPLRGRGWSVSRPGGGGLRKALTLKGDQAERREATPEQTAVKEKREEKDPQGSYRNKGRRLPSSSSKVTMKGPCRREKVT